MTWRPFGKKRDEVQFRWGTKLALNGGYAQVYAGLAMVNNIGPLGSP